MHSYVYFNICKTIHIITEITIHTQKTFRILHRNLKRNSKLNEISVLLSSYLYIVMVYIYINLINTFYCCLTHVYILHVIL